MKKFALLFVSALLFVGAIVFLLSLLSDSSKQSDVVKTTESETELDKSLRNSHPSEEELEREISMLRESAGAQETKATAEPERDVAKLIAAPKPAADRGYDLPALEQRLIGALQNTDVAARRASLQEIAAFLAGIDNETATRFMKAILETRDESTDSDGYAFASVFVDELSHTDPAAALAWSEILPTQLKYSAYQILARNWVPQDPQAADRWIQKIPDDGLRASVIRMMSQSLAIADQSNYGPAWAQRLGQSKDGFRLSDVVVSQWAKTDFDAAYQWAGSLADADDRKTGLLALAKVKAQTDAPAAAAWARDSLEGSARSIAIQNTLVTWSSKDPASVAAWVEKLSDPKISDATFDTIALSWMKKDEAKARQWIAAAKVPQQRKDYIEVVGRR